MAQTLHARLEPALTELKKDTGRTLDEWVALTKAQRHLSDQKARKAWLQAEHRMHPDWAWLVASTASGAADYRDYDALVNGMFAGKKAALRPIYDRLVEMGHALGSDVTLGPCRTQVALRRKHNFALLKPGSNSRLDLGLAVGKAKRKPPKRLIDTGGLAKGDRITHRIPLVSVDEIDAEVQRWLKIAYDLDA